MMPAMRRAPGLAVLALLLATGCGGGPAPAATVTVTATAAPAASESALSTAPPPAASGSTAIATAASGATYAVDCSTPGLDQADYMACVNAGHQPPQPTGGATSDSGGLVGTVDQAAHSVTWPDGRKITVLSIARVPDAAYREAGLPAPDAGTPTVYVRFRVEQTGPPTDWGAWGPSLLYGPNQQDADIALGIGTTYQDTNTPRRLTQGNSVVIPVAYSVPTAGLSTLAVSVPGGVEAPYESETIEGLASLLR